MNFQKFIELCFQTVVPGCEYNDYQYMKVIADRLKAASVGEVIPISITRETDGQQWKKSHNEVSKIVEV